jgi:GNAT superfamily N-acetyltransferase
VKPDIRRAVPDDARQVAVLAGEALNEMMSMIGKSGFRFRLAEMIAERAAFLECGEYAIYIASTPRGHPLGFLTLFESQANHISDPFGTVAELYVRPEYRRRGIGHWLLEQAKSHARSHRWTSLQLAMPASVQPGGALAFFERKRFADAGGRKMKLAL